MAVLNGGVLGATRRKRDLIYENMVTDNQSLSMILTIHVLQKIVQVMRNKYNSTTRDEMRKTMVGGGILERKVIAAKNGTENRHEESRGETSDRRKSNILSRDGVLQHGSSDWGTQWWSNGHSGRVPSLCHG